MIRKSRIGGFGSRQPEINGRYVKDTQKLAGELAGDSRFAISCGTKELGRYGRQHVAAANQHAARTLVADQLGCENEITLVEISLDTFSTLGKVQRSSGPQLKRAGGCFQYVAGDLPVLMSRARNCMKTELRRNDDPTDVNSYPNYWCLKKNAEILGFVGKNGRAAPRGNVAGTQSRLLDNHPNAGTTMYGKRRTGREVVSEKAGITIILNPKAPQIAVLSIAELGDQRVMT